MMIRRLRVGVESRPVGGAVGGPHRTEATNVDDPIRGRSVDAPPRTATCFRPCRQPRRASGCTRIRTGAGRRRRWRDRSDGRARRPTPVRRARRCRAMTGQRRAHRRRRRGPVCDNSDSVIAPSRLARRLPVGSDDEGHVGVRAAPATRAPVRWRSGSVSMAGDRHRGRRRRCRRRRRRRRRPGCTPGHRRCGAGRRRRAGPSIGSDDDIVDDNNGVRRRRGSESPAARSVRRRARLAGR